MPRRIEAWQAGRPALRAEQIPQNEEHVCGAFGEPPHYQQFEVPQLPEVPPQDDPANPGFMPVPGGRHPFFPPDRDPLLPRDGDDAPGGDQPGPRPDDP